VVAMKKLLFQIALSAYLNVLCFRNVRPSCTEISKQYNDGSKSLVISHDALQRLLQIEREWNRLFRKNYGHLLGKNCGYLIIDDTVLEKPFSSELELLAWLWSTSKKSCVYGIGTVFVIWTDVTPVSP